jgi:hypothetical protein
MAEIKIEFGKAYIPTDGSGNRCLVRVLEIDGTQVTVQRETAPNDTFTLGGKGQLSAEWPSKNDPPPGPAT